MSREFASSHDKHHPWDKSLCLMLHNLLIATRNTVYSSTMYLLCKLCKPSNILENDVAKDSRKVTVCSRQSLPWLVLKTTLYYIRNTLRHPTRCLRDISWLISNDKWHWDGSINLVYESSQTSASVNITVFNPSILGFSLNFGCAN